MPLSEDDAQPSLREAVAEKPFSPYDPEAIQPTSARPAPSRETPGNVGDTSGEDGEAPGGQSPGEAQDQEDTPGFDPRYKDDFIGLMYLGRLSHTFDLLGHEVVIRTLTTEELAEISMFMKPYEGTAHREGIYAAVIAGVCTESVDGQPLPQPITRNSTGALERIRYSLKNWLPPVHNRIFQEYYALDLRASRVLDQMGKQSG